jgi:hypothetical protein
MALEKELWKRLKTGAAALRAVGHKVDLQRLENSVAAGHPAVEGCIDGNQLWIENKSEARPKKIDTPLHPKVRPSQSIWHKQRVQAGCRINWVLLQVGDAHDARLYLIPGCYYDRLKSIAEVELKALSVVPPTASPADVLIRAASPW